MRRFGNKLIIETINIFIDTIEDIFIAMFEQLQINTMSPFFENLEEECLGIQRTTIET